MSTRFRAIVCLAAFGSALACCDTSSDGSNGEALRVRGVIAPRSHEAGIVRVRWVPVSAASGYVGRILCGADGEILDHILLTPNGCAQLLSDGFDAGLCESDVVIAPFQGICSDVRVGISAVTDAGESATAYPLMLTPD